MQSVCGPRINRSITTCESRVRDSELRIGSWTATARYTSLGMKHTGSPLASQSLSACVLHMDSVWLWGLAGPSCRTHSREIRNLLNVSLYCVHPCETRLLCFCVRCVVYARCARGCAPSQNVVEPATNAHIFTTTHPQQPSLATSWMLGLPDEFLSPATRVTAAKRTSR